MKILVVGDSFVPVAVFREGFAPLEKRHSVSYLQLDEALPPTAPTDSGRRIREYLGTPEEVAAHLGENEVLVVHGAPVTEEVLAAGSDLRLVCCARGGPVNVDVAAATLRRIPVVNTPGKNADAVADQTLAFLVMLARGFPRAQQFLMNGGRLGQSAYEGAQFLGHELGGHVLGLVGYGNVGRRVSRRALAFGMSVAVYDPYVEVKNGEGVQQVRGLADLLAMSDFVSLHVRASSQTESLFGPEEFGQMRQGAYFVNTARETLVDEGALEGPQPSHPGDHVHVGVGQAVDDAVGHGRPKPAQAAVARLLTDDDVLGAHVAGGLDDGAGHVAPREDREGAPELPGELAEALGPLQAVQVGLDRDHEARAATPPRQSDSSSHQLFGVGTA